MNATKALFIGLLLGATLILGLSFTNNTSEKSQKKENTQINDKGFADRYTIASPPLPSQVTFAGELIPIENKDVFQRLEREMLVNTYWQSNTSLLIKRAYSCFTTIEGILAEEGVPDDFKYLAMAESGLTNAASPAGARGFWQFMKATGKAYGLEINSEVDERYHLEKATRAACKYLKNSKDRFGSWSLAAAAYNRGEGGISAALKKQKVDNYYDLYLNSETARYVYRIIALKYIHQNHTDYGFVIGANEKYKAPNFYLEEISKSNSDLPQLAKDHGTNYKTLRALNPWLRSYTLTISTGNSYIIRWPELELNAADE